MTSRQCSGSAMGLQTSYLNIWRAGHHSFPLNEAWEKKRKYLRIFPRKQIKFSLLRSKRRCHVRFWGPFHEKGRCFSNVTWCSATTMLTGVVVDILELSCKKKLLGLLEITRCPRGLFFEPLEEPRKKLKARISWQTGKAKRLNSMLGRRDCGLHWETWGEY